MCITAVTSPLSFGNGWVGKVRGHQGKLKLPACNLYSNTRDVHYLICTPIIELTRNPYPQHLLCSRASEKNNNKGMSSSDCFVMANSDRHEEWPSYLSIMIALILIIQR